MVHCHCSMCRKHHGAMFATFLTGRRAGASAGWPARMRDRRAIARRRSGLRPFCRTCGSVAPTVLPDSALPSCRPATSRAIPGSGPSCTCSRPRAPPGSRSPTRLPQCATLSARVRGRRVRRQPAPAPQPPASCAADCLCGDVACELTGQPEMPAELPLLALPARAQRRARDERVLQARAAHVDPRRRRTSRVSRCPAPSASARISAAAAAAPSRASWPRRVTSSCPAAASTIAPGSRRRGNIFAGSKAPWYEITDGRPQWEALPA